MGKKFFAYLLFGLAVSFLFFFGANKIPLWSSDEGRYGEIAREMWESKNFILPHFNYIEHLEKPVLAPLLSSFCYAVFGGNALSIRLVPIVSALLGIYVCYAFTRRLFDQRTARFAAFILTTSVGYVLVGRFAVIDMLMTFLLSASLFCLMTAYFEGKRKFYLAAYVLMGLAFLTKGLIGMVLPGLVFLVFLTIRKNLGEIKNMSLLWGVIIIGLIIIPWCIAMSLQEPAFFDYFIIKSHFGRFATGSFGRRRPFWFFVPILIGLAAPWTFFIPAAVARAFKQPPREKDKIQFLLCWMAVIFLFFSMPASKLPYYILPICMPLAILIATLFADWTAPENRTLVQDHLTKIIWGVIPWIFFLGFLGLNGCLFFGKKEARVLTLQPFLHVGSGILLGGGLLAYAFYKKSRIKNAIFSLGGMIYLSMILTTVGMKAITPFESSFAFAQALQPQLKAEDTVAVFASPDRFSDLPYYLKRRILVVGDRGTLTVPTQRPKYADEVKKWFLTDMEFSHFFNDRTKRVFCLMEKENLQYLQSAGIKNYTVIQEVYGKILISNA